ncbi:glycosyltransferase family 4 protein [Burkholderia cenocepacia]|uniref:glycosyltransferase family 4 protein n=1 Tax=Burkholderia cenocepacia TaxID=95486 RepID=UPI0009813D69|nr:glycosyltransferase family 4 protein [Burkholderia cenocepacia]ONR59822.1 glycosyl transferase family 1 [Burkholderia cenocepacia]ONS19424.1 glycosyl transferase family 1 [Burkholderia cenocepacia]ONS21199.1 glycosyl transferase family 1 [Burkholderia cenocepacia]ONS31103.1 glycosyl transferase family 1 [Burkholderia cenocepacia]ONS45266.1 glycosyl transferase family 1 [Burkholderia cenocepacia]
MNILYTNFHGGNGGGHDTYIYQLAAGLGCRYRVAVALPAGSRLSRMVDTLPGVCVVDMQFKPGWRAFVPKLLRLRHLIAQSVFDVIHVNGSADHRQIMLALAGYRKRPPVVFTKHNTYAAGSVGNFLRARFATDRTIAVSDYVRGMLERQSPYNDITVIKHGVQPPSQALGHAEIHRRRAEYFGNEGADAIVLGSVAGTAEHKGWSDLVIALARLSPALRARFRVMLAGDWPSPEQRAFVKRSGVGELVAFVGPTDRTHDVLEACDVSFVLSYHESLSYACREAMSMGRAVIVTAVGGLPENVSDRVDGWIVPPRSPDAVAAVLLEIAAHPERAVRMGRAARARSEYEFGFQRFIDETASVYRALVRKAATRT